MRRNFAEAVLICPAQRFVRDDLTELDGQTGEHRAVEKALRRDRLQKNADQLPLLPAVPMDGPKHWTVRADYQTGL